MILTLFICFLLTVIIELIVLFVMDERKKSILLYSVFINLITNIPLNIYLYLHAFDGLLEYMVIVLALETIIVFIESSLYNIIIRDNKRSFIYSLFCNMYSFLVGIIISFILILLFH